MTAITYVTLRGEARSRLMPSTLASAFIAYLRRAGATGVTVVTQEIQEEES